MNQFDELFNSFKSLNEEEKKKAIIDFLKTNIYHMNEINKQINNNLSSDDVSKISEMKSDEYLDIIYQLLHIMTEQVEMFSEKIAKDFFE